MDPFWIENASHHQALVKAYKPPASKSKGDVSRNMDMVVAMRLRPMLSDETAAGFVPAVFDRASEAGAVDMHELRKKVRGLPVLSTSSYQVDRAYGIDTTTEAVYEDAVQPLVPWAWSGGISTLFAYGQTGSGKTYSVSRMEQLVAGTLFDGALEGERKVYLTMVELAGRGNTCFDLLNSRKPVSILEDAFGVTQLAGATEHDIASTDSMLELIQTANKYRETAATEKNDASSRSHAICRIRIENPATPTDEDGILYMIDLAGSEIARDMTEHTTERMRETRDISVSLSILKDCIRGKAEADVLAATPAGPSGKKKNPPHVPFRQSALTKVLKHIFDVNGTRGCKTVVIACVSPCIADVSASKNTLRYAEMLRVLVPVTKPPTPDPKVPFTWDNAHFKEWVRNESGTPAINADILAPFENGPQMLRLPAPEFEARCKKTEGVTPEQAKAFRSKLWQFHIDSQRRPASKPVVVEAEDEDTVLGHLEKEGLSSRDNNPTLRSLDFKHRFRPGMVISFTPPKYFWPRPSGEIMMAMLLSPASAVKDGVVDIAKRTVNTGVKGQEGVGVGYRSGLDYTTTENDSGERWLCALVMPGILPQAYEIAMWRQVVLDEAWMDAEVLLEYQPTMRYYFIVL